MKIALDESLLVGYLLNPFNLYNASYVSASMVYWNERVNVSMKVKWRVKGQSTRTNIKKAWDIKFAQPWLGLKKISIKNGNGPNPAADSILKGMLECVALRGCNVPVGRTGFFVLYVNERFEGLYYFEEPGDDVPFLESRFGTSEGNLMKLHWHVILQYLGNDPKTYLDMKMHLFDNSTTDCNEKKSFIWGFFTSCFSPQRLSSANWKRRHFGFHLVFVSIEPVSNRSSRFNL